MNPQLRLRQIS